MSQPMMGNRIYVVVVNINLDPPRFYSACKNVDYLRIEYKCDQVNVL